MVPVARLQNYLRQNAALKRVQMSVPPFTLFLQPHVAEPCASFAIPDQPTPFGSLMLC